MEDINLYNEDKYVNIVYSIVLYTVYQKFAR